MPKIKLIDVAERAGVSKSTVSQYLNGRFDYIPPRDVRPGLYPQLPFRKIDTGRKNGRYRYGVCAVTRIG